MKLSAIKLTPEPTPPNATPVQDGKTPISLQFLRQFNKEFTAMTRKDLEYFLLQKVVEALGYKSEISELRQRLEKSETQVLSFRTKANELSKQLRDLEMVHQQVITDLEKQNKTQVTPVIITRSIGLQVSRSRTQEQRPRQVQAAPLNSTQSGGIRTIAVGGQNLAATVAAQQQQRTVLIQRSPGKTLSPQQQQQFMQRSQIISQRAPQTNIEQAVRGQQQYMMKYTPMRPPLSNADQVRIDSQQKEEEAAWLAIQQKRVTMQRSQQENQRVQHLQMLAQQQQQQQIQQNQNVIRMNITQTPPNAISEQRIKSSHTSSIATRNTSVALPQLRTMSVGRTVATKSTAPPQRQGHPAPLPPFVAPSGNLMWKNIPPKPTIRVNRIETGIFISWTMSDIQTGDEFANITSYQIFAYEETSAPPATDMWRHVGDVKAMPLPMAITLTQFQEGERYFFSVRAVDEHNRFGPFSSPKIWDFPMSD